MFSATRSYKYSLGITGNQNKLEHKDQSVQRLPEGFLVIKYSHFSAPKFAFGVFLAVQVYFKFAEVRYMYMVICAVCLNIKSPGNLLSRWQRVH